MRFFNQLIAVLGLVALLAAPTVQANPLYEQICRANPDSTFCREMRGEAPQNRLFGPGGIVARVVGLLSFVIGVGAVVMIIIGGLKYITSSGDPNNTNAAKNTIIYALIGLLIALFAQAIIIFVIDRL